MDLFAGYGSSSDEEENNPKQNETKVVSAVTATAAVSTAASSSSSKSKSTTAAMRRGKKIISLSAVLPQHILDQLTKAEGASDDSDSDDEDENDYNHKVGTRKPNPKPPVESASLGNSSNNAKDKGLASLLSDLQAAPTQGLIGSKKKKTETNSVASEKMGAAFLSSTTTTSTTATSAVEATQHGEVRDIHSHSSSSSLPVETRKAAPSLSRVAAPRPAAPLRRPISAAPPVAPLPPKAPPIPRPAYPQPTASAQQQQHSYPDSYPETETATPNTQQSKKRSRKELERALRGGNMDIIDDREDGLQVQSMQQVQPDAYTPQEESYAAVPVHGVKVAPTAMYDPSAGQAVVGTSAAGVKRGTNQINQLMASAANLEQQRTQGIGATANQAGKTHRANAKSKYGW
jgi:hypothetical protein